MQAADDIDVRTPLPRPTLRRPIASWPGGQPEGPETMPQAKVREHAPGAPQDGALEGEGE